MCINTWASYHKDTSFARNSGQILESCKISEELWILRVWIGQERGNNIRAIFPQETRTEISHKEEAWSLFKQTAFILISPKWYSERFQELNHWYTIYIYLLSQFIMLRNSSRSFTKMHQTLSNNSSSQYFNRFWRFKRISRWAAKEI